MAGSNKSLFTPGVLNKVDNKCFVIFFTAETIRMAPDEKKLLVKLYKKLLLSAFPVTGEGFISKRLELFS